MEKIWPHATEPAFESFDKSQQELFLNLLKNNKNISEIAEECQYFFTDYFSAKNPDVVKANLEEKFANFISERKLIKDALQNDAEKLGTATEKHEKWLVTLPENQKKIAEYLQLIMKTRDRRKNFFAKGLTVIHRIAEKMFSEVGLSYDLIPFYTMKELVKGVGYLRDNVDILKTRTKGFQLLIPASSSVKMLEIPIEQAVEKVNEFFVTSHTTESGVDILNGQVGSRGSVRGNVRIVLNVNSNHGFKNGEILVTGMTRPEYIPLMKKAAGIVTDEGGITCHAAIVSRELGIPCVIGTKIATRKLKDGDLVEVDANKGIVKIIK